MDVLVEGMGVRAYEAAAVETVLAIAADEEIRLAVLLDEVQGRIDAARALLAAATSLRERMGELVLEADRRHQRLRAEGEAEVRRILEAADDEVDALLAAARADALARSVVGVGPGRQAAPLVIEASAVVIDLADRRVLEVG